MYPQHIWKKFLLHPVQVLKNLEEQQLKAVTSLRKKVKTSSFGIYLQVDQNIRRVNKPKWSMLSIWNVYKM